MKTSKYILTVLLLCLLCVPMKADESQASEPEKKVNVQEIVFGHIGDSYEWHITEWKGKAISIPLPIIVYSSQSGWHIFLSLRLIQNKEYEGFYIAEDGKYQGKVVEKNAPEPIVSG